VAAGQANLWPRSFVEQFLKPDIAIEDCATIDMKQFRHMITYYLFSSISGLEKLGKHFSNPDIGRDRYIGI
jgi:hypothetical protein